MLLPKMYRNFRARLSSFIWFRYDILRFFLPFLVEQRPDLAIHKFTKLISENQEIPFYGDGSTARDYTFINDIVDGIIKSIVFVEKTKTFMKPLILVKIKVITLNEMLSGIEAELGKLPLKKTYQCNQEMYKKQMPISTKPKISSIICQRPTIKMA